MEKSRKRTTGEGTTAGIEKKAKHSAALKSISMVRIPTDPRTHSNEMR